VLTSSQQSLVDMTVEWLTAMLREGWTSLAAPPLFSIYPPAHCNKQNRGTTQPFQHYLFIIFSLLLEFYFESDPVKNSSSKIVTILSIYLASKISYSKMFENNKATVGCLISFPALIISFVLNDFLIDL